MTSPSKSRSVIYFSRNFQSKLWFRNDFKLVTIPLKYKTDLLLSKWLPHPYIFEAEIVLTYSFRRFRTNSIKLFGLDEPKWQIAAISFCFSSWFSWFGPIISESSAGIVRWSPFGMISLCFVLGLKKKKKNYDLYPVTIAWLFSWGSCSHNILLI